MPLLDLLTAFTGVDPLPLLVAMAVTTAAAAVQGTIGFGFGLVSVPALSLLDPRLAPVPQMLVILPLAVQMAWSERRGIDRGVGYVLLGRLPGAAIGATLVASFDRAGLELLIAGIIGAAVIGSLRPSRARHPAHAGPGPSRGLRFGAGAVSGVSSYVAGIGGPPIALAYRDAPGATLRATLAIVFTFGLTLTLSTRALAGHFTATDLRVAATLLPFVGLGVLASGPLRPRVEGPRLRTLVLLAASVSAAGLAVRALGA